MKKRKDPAAVAMGRKGGKKRAQNLSQEQRSAIAAKAAQDRWKAVREAAMKAATE